MKAIKRPRRTRTTRELHVLQGVKYQKTESQIRETNGNFCFTNTNPYTRDLILKYLEPKDVIAGCIRVSKEWRSLILKSNIWDFYSRKYGVLARVAFNGRRILCDRRSKGKIYRGQYFGAFTDESVTPVAIRKVNLATINAGYNDGVPSSIMRECAYLQKLSHPGIVKYYGSQIIGEYVFVVMEYFSHNLYDFLLSQHNGKFSQGASHGEGSQLVLQIFKDILKAVEYIHSCGIIHRNLKPENIFIKCSYEYDCTGALELRFKSVKIGDMASSRYTNHKSGAYTPEQVKQRESSTRENRRLFYKAPELFLRVECYDAHVDMWSLGVVFYELACRKHLFCGMNEIEIFWDICKARGIPSFDHGPLAVASFNKWANVIIAWDPIPIHDVMAATYYSGSISVEVLKKYEKLGQKSALFDLCLFYDNMGKGPMEMLYKLLEMNYNTRCTASEALELYKRWDVHYIQKRSLAYKRYLSSYSCNASINSFINHYIAQVKTTKTQLDIDAVRGNVVPPSQAQEKFQNGLWMNPRPRETNGMSRSVQIINKMNAKLCELEDYWPNIVNWFYLIRDKFEMNNETVHLAVSYMYKAIQASTRSQYDINDWNLLSSACLKLADRFNELSQEYYRSSNSDEYAIVGNAFLLAVADNLVKSNGFHEDQLHLRILTGEMIISWENQILNLLHFDLLSDTLASKVNAYGQILCCSNAACVNYCHMLANMSMHDYRCCMFPADLRAQVIWLISIYKHICCESSNGVLFDMWNLVNSSRIQRVQLLDVDDEEYFSSSGTTRADTCSVGHSGAFEALKYHSEGHSIGMDHDTRGDNVMEKKSPLGSSFACQERVTRLDSCETFHNDTIGKHQDILKCLLKPLGPYCMGNSVSEVLKCTAHLEQLALVGIENLLKNKILWEFQRHQVTSYKSRMPAKLVIPLINERLHEQLQSIAKWSYCDQFQKGNLKADSMLESKAKGNQVIPNDRDWTRYI
ncbi:bifunctional Protein kinase domain/Protein kinase-like domain superfamily/Cyclin-like superfamily/Cyclin [Babesia duncani]|uniref:Bifunctional Protein kinase domain/Protein kinase-like domain superfamily/Cyclin-like superfamily/Cyclin n=1 Tax=Babesia duncani TaxID=323732 RepID=A0AAD9PP02_9APIC|nr:bifunctional Protein kinase domain/Protein kinase-like domain superfamily/Cyclin-like superfamily/Cyclin [Babesia duncani]